MAEIGGRGGGRRGKGKGRRGERKGRDGEERGRVEEKGGGEGRRGEQRGGRKGESRGAEGRRGKGREGEGRGVSVSCLQRSVHSLARPRLPRTHAHSYLQDPAIMGKRQKERGREPFTLTSTPNTPPHPH